MWFLKSLYGLYCFCCCVDCITIVCSVIGILQGHGKIAATAIKAQMIHQFIKTRHINGHTHIDAQFTGAFALCPTPKGENQLKRG